VLAQNDVFSRWKKGAALTGAINRAIGLDEIDIVVQ
jgi:hypothetical protein